MLLDLFYKEKVTAINIMSLLDINSGGLHALGMILLCTDMMQYYVQADGIPQFIVMMEDAQKNAKQAGMPITNVELVMMVLAAVLAAQHFPHEVDNWEGLLAGSCTWQAWKVAFCFPTSSTSANSKLWGEVYPLAVPTR